MKKLSRTVCLVAFLVIVALLAHRGKKGEDNQ